MNLEGAVRLGYSKELAAETDPVAQKALYDSLVAKSYERGKAVNVAQTVEIVPHAVVVDALLVGHGSFWSESDRTLCRLKSVSRFPCSLAPLASLPQLLAQPANPSPDIVPAIQRNPWEDEPLTKLSPTTTEPSGLITVLMLESSGSRNPSA